MATYTFQTLGLDQFSISGTDPFSGTANTTPGAVGTVLTLSPSAQWSSLSVDDDELHLHDDDAGQQNLVSPLVINGTTYPIGTHIEGEYSYVIRPTGSSDPADNINIYAINAGGTIVGFASDSPLSDGASYTVVAYGSDAPSVHYPDLVVCFASGTGILTPYGERPVENLVAGDLVQTLDNGLQPIVWAGRQVTRAMAGAKAPVRVGRGLLGNSRDLYLSPQHRVLIADPEAGEVLLPAKALLAIDGVRQVPHARIGYHHLLFERHEVIFADGAPAESLYPGPTALKAIGAQSARALIAAFPEIGQGALWEPARRLVRPGQLGRV